MSSSYPAMIMGLNPVYYWRFNRWPSLFRYGNLTYGYIQEENRTSANNASNTGNRSEGYFFNASMPSSPKHPHAPDGPIAGGDSRGMMTYTTWNPAGPRMLLTGTATSFTHEAPVGRNNNFSIVVWFKSIPAMPAGATNTQHILTSSRNSDLDQHFSVAERQSVVDSVDSNELKIKTKAADETEDVTFSENYNQWNSTGWTMLTLTSALVTSGTTPLTDGTKLYINNRLHMKRDSTYGAMSDSPSPSATAYMYLMSSYTNASTPKPGACAECAMFDRVLNAGEVESIYHQAVSPSPARVRGGIHRQLGRLI